MPTAPPVVLTIAGFDPSSGAGVTADIKTIAAHGCYGLACITALTVQSTSGVRRVEALKPALVSETLEELARDVDISAVHVGMLANAALVETVADFLARRHQSATVLDPILRSSSGAELVDERGTELLARRMIPLSAVLTPNAEEAASLTGLKTRTLEEIREAARKLHDMGAAAVVITGGHMEKATDLLSFTSRQGIEQEVFKSPRLESKSTHGTGCAFASAIACHLAHHRGLPEAVMLAKAYISAAIAKAHPLGKGTGPLNHLYRMEQKRRAVIDEFHPEPPGR
jgi:hydroxymethylpyrimidine/phosphomethylpyrimidine kinase